MPVVKRRKLWIGLAAALGLLAAGGAYLVRSLSSVPDFYRQAQFVRPEAAQQASDECLRRAAALSGAARHAGPWQVRFTAEQINGWLAVDLVRNHPALLPAELAEPRVALGPGGVQLGCRYMAGGRSVVLSLLLDVQITSTQALAVRFKHARAGALPVPIGQVLRAVSAAAESARLPLQWRQLDGDPVALVGWQDLSAGATSGVRLEQLELRPGEAILRGRSGPDASRPPLARRPGDRDS
jgi:hypothetical protein